MQINAMAVLLFSHLLLLATAVLFVWAKRNSDEELANFCEFFSLIVMALTPLVPLIESVFLCGLTLRV